MQNKARNILQLKIQIRACIPYRDGSQPTILHSDHATVGPHGCFEIMLKMTGMIMTRIVIMIMSSSSFFWKPERLHHPESNYSSSFRKERFQKVFRKVQRKNGMQTKRIPFVQARQGPSPTTVFCRLKEKNQV